jgi:hypothetical protein
MMHHPSFPAIRISKTSLTNRRTVHVHSRRQEHRSARVSPAIRALSRPNRPSLTAPRWSAAPPGKGGSTHLGLPVFDTVREAREKIPARQRHLCPATLRRRRHPEAIDAEVPLIVCITEGIPVLDMVKVSALVGRDHDWSDPTVPA